MKLNKNIKIFFNYILGPALFVWLCFSIYTQVAARPNLAENWEHIKTAFYSNKIFYLIATFLLTIVNLGIEAYKWKLAVKQIQHVSFITAFKAVLSGISFSVSTPNRVGEYLGRVLYMNDGNRIKAVSLTIVGSMSQLITTIAMGLIGLIILKDTIIEQHVANNLFVRMVLYGTVFALALLTLFYFRLSWLIKIIDKLPSIKKYSWTIEALEHFNATLLLRFLSLSISRYAVFTLQYYLLFQFFDVQLSFIQVALGTSVMFLVMAIIPTIALFTDLALKNEVILKLLGIFSNNALGISLTSLSIWLLNLVIPALIGSLLLLGIKKLFKHKNENA